MDKLLENYNKNKNMLLYNKKIRQEKLDVAIQKYEEIKNSNIDKKEQRLQLAATNVNRRKYALNIIEEELSYLRPAISEDIEYRLRQYKEFTEEVRNCIPEDLPLRFHGCPIYAAKKIIESGEISSSADRQGFETSYDTNGQISVTTKESLDITVTSYAGLIDNYNLPAGCIFVLLPKDDFDRECGKSLLMGNVSFKKEPSRLFGIITTPENIPRVNIWCQENNIETNKIYDYDNFTLLFNQNKSIRR